MPYPFYETTNDYTPINDIVPVTPSDTTDLQYNGDTLAGRTVTLTIGTTWFGVQYIRAKRIRATGTTATVFACY